MAWNPAKEAELASVGSDGVARFWDVRNRGMCVGEVKIGGEGFSMSWRPDGEELVIGRKVFHVPFLVFTLCARLSKAEISHRNTTDRPLT